MERIKFKGVWGDRYFDVELSDPGGGVGGSYHLYIKRRFFGHFAKINDEWVYLRVKPDGLTGDDIQILQRLIEEQ